MEDWVREAMEDYLAVYQKKEKSKRGFYNAWTKKEMEAWIKQAAHYMDAAVSQQRYEDEEF
jgi:hypothetical protein